MSYFHKKTRPDQSSFNYHIDESTISNGADDCLVINSNIFNKSNIQSQNQNQNNKIGYSQISQGKNCSPISYLKNFKKVNTKSNQQNIYVDQSKLQMPTVKNSGSMKKQYELMMNELMAGQTLQQNNRSNTKQQNSNARHGKSKSYNEDKQNFQINHETSSINHPFLNDQEEQSMQELLNSSINQFQRFLQQQNEHSSSGGYEKNTNVSLHKTLSKFKSILKQKLQHGLLKQKQEMKNMLSEYVELITKLLHDKQEMSTHIQQIQEQLGNKTNQISNLLRKVQDINHQKDQHIHKTKQQIDEFLIIIQQFENQAKQETQKFDQLQKQIDRLKPFENQLKEIQIKQGHGHKRYSSQQFQDQQKRIQCQSQKIQTLLELLEKSQHQTNQLKEILSKQNSDLNTLRKQASQQANSVRSQNSRSSQGQSYQFTQQQMEEIKAFYEQKIQQLEIQHEQEFIEYEKAIKQTLTKKDECIERLNFIISELRDGRKSPFKGRSSEQLKHRQNQQNRSEKYIKQQKRATYEQQMDIMSQKTFNDQEIIE